MLHTCFKTTERAYRSFFARLSLIFLSAISFTGVLHALNLENQTGQKIRMHIISQQGEEFVTDLENGSPYIYTANPLFIMVYGYNDKICAKFFPDGTGGFDTITFKAQNRCFVGYYKSVFTNQSFATDQPPMTVNRTACLRDCWDPTRELIHILTPEQQKQQSLVYNQHKQKREAAPEGQNAPQRGQQTGERHGQEHKQKTGLRITNLTQQPLKIRIYTNDGEEIFGDVGVGENNGYVMEPNKQLVNMTVYPKTGTQQPAIGFPRLGADRSFDELIILGNSNDMSIAYRQGSREGRRSGLRNIPTAPLRKSDPNNSRSRGWDASKNAIYSSTYVSASLPPAPLVPR